jgi:hypothetical protein
MGDQRGRRLSQAVAMVQLSPNLQSVPFCSDVFDKFILYTGYDVAKSWLPRHVTLCSTSLFFRFVCGDFFYLCLPVFDENRGNLKVNIHP